MNVLLVYPHYPDSFWSFRHALRFISKKAALPPLGLITVSAMLPSTWQKKLVDMNVTSLKTRDIQWADYVFISAMYIQKKSVDKIIDECVKYGVKIVAGGPLFTREYKNYIQIDHFILNEAVKHHNPTPSPNPRPICFKLPNIMYFLMLTFL